MKGGGRSQVGEAAIKLFPMPGLLASLARGGGPVCQGKLLGQGKLGKAGA